MADWRHDLLDQVGDQCLECIANVTQMVTNGTSLGNNCTTHPGWSVANEEDRITCGPFALNVPYYRACRKPNANESLPVLNNTIRCANDDGCAKACVTQFLNIETRDKHCGRTANFRRYCVDYGAIQAGGHSGDGCDKKSSKEIADFVDKMKIVCGVTEPDVTSTAEPGYVLTVVVPVVVASLLICIIVLGVAWFYRRKRQLQRLAEPNVYSDLGLIVADLCPSSYSAQIQELVRKRGIDPTLLVLSTRLGQGHFGVVRKGNLTNSSKTTSIPIAAKILKASQPTRQDIEAFLNEAVFMMKLGHPNVLHLLGIVWEENSLPVLILPFMGKGDLHTVICKNPLFNEADLINFGDQILTGCQYLEQHSVIHRDIALANCLVSDLFVVKLADFGLSRDDHYYCNIKERDLRWKWLAPECISRGSFSHKSDVWAFGVLLWEMFSNGATPHSAMGSLSVLQECLEGGYRMSQPIKMPGYLYDLIKEMWGLTPEVRPSFAEMDEFFKLKMKELEGDIDYDYTPDKMENLFPSYEIYISSNSSTYSDNGLFSCEFDENLPQDSNTNPASVPPNPKPRNTISAQSPVDTRDLADYLVPKRFNLSTVDPSRLDQDGSF